MEAFDRKHVMDNLLESAFLMTRGQWELIVILDDCNDECRNVGMCNVRPIV